MNTRQMSESSTAVLDSKHAHHLLYQMLLIRRFEEKCAELYSKMKIRGFLHLYIGEEAVAVGIMQALFGAVQPLLHSIPQQSSLNP